MTEPKPPPLPSDRAPMGSTVDNRGASIGQQVIAHTVILESAAIDALVTTGPYAVEDQPLVRVLKPWEVRRPRTAQPAKLLEAAYEVVPFDARADVLERLQRFTDEEERDGVQVIVGPGGVGKTRLMLEWCKRLRAREEPWLAGFLQRDLPDDLGRLVLGRAPRLVVLDCAETEPATTARVVRAMVHRRDGPPMRVVLLAREDGSWLRDLRKDDLAVEDCVDAHEVVRLGPLYETAEARARGFSRAKAGFRDFEGVQAAEPEGDEARERPVLDEALGERVLYLHMQALLEAYGDEDALEGRLSPAQVLERVVDHECGFWKRSFEARGRSVTKRLMQAAEQAAAALVLCGGVPDATAARRLLEAAAPSCAVVDREAVLVCFGELYEDRPDGEGIVPIEPDLLGETLLARVMERDAKQEGGLERWLRLPFGDAAPPLAVGRALTMLTRLASRAVGVRWLQTLLREHGREVVERVHVSANEGRPEPSGSVLEEAVRWVDFLEVAEAIGAAVPSETVELREVRATTYGIAVRLARCRDDVDDVRIAGLLANLGRALGMIGKREEALAVTQEAVKLYRRLAKEQPDAVLPALASAVHNLGVWLSDVGMREEALVITQEAAEITHWLATECPDSFLPSLAMTLNNLGLRLSEVGRREEALAVTQDVVKIYRGLAKERPDSFLHFLAMALNNLGLRLSEVGRREAALAVTQEAVEVTRGLAKERPDAVLPSLASALNNLGLRLSEVGRREEALAITQEAMEVHRGLAKERPDAFLPDFANAVNNFGLRLSDLGRREEALAATQEAMGVFRRLAKERPDAFLPSLATALNNLGGRLRNVGRRKEALAITKEAVEIFRGLAKELPDAFLPFLASTLNNLGTDLNDVGRREEALTITQDVVNVYRVLAKARPGAFLPSLAMALNNLGGYLSEMARGGEGLAVTREAVDIRRRLAKKRPDVFLPSLATALNNLGASLNDVGKREEALVVIQEAVDIRRRLAKEQPDAFAPSLAKSLGILGNVHEAAHRHQEALSAFVESLMLIHPFLQRFPQVLENQASWLARGARRASQDGSLPLPVSIASMIAQVLDRVTTA